MNMVKRILKELEPKSVTDWIIVATAAVWIVYSIFK